MRQNLTLVSLEGRGRYWYGHDVGDGVQVAILDAGRMTSRANAIHEVSAALQFPLPYTENFSAVEDWLRNMEWYSHIDSFRVVVDDAGLILGTEGELQSDTMLAIFVSVARHWASPDAARRAPDGGPWFELELACREGDLAAMRLFVDAVP